MEPFPSSGLQSSHLNICYYHQDPHRRPLRPGSRQGFAATAAPSYSSGPWHLPRRPGVGRALKRHPFSGLVDSAVSLRASTRVSSGFAPLRHSSLIFRVPTGMLTLEPFSEDQGRSAVHPARGIPPISFLAPCGFTHPLTRTHVRLLGPCFKTGEWGAHRPVPGARRYIAETCACCQPPIDATASPRAYRQLGLWPPHQSAPVHDPESIGRTGYRRSTSDRDASPAPHSLPSRQFQALFDSLFKGPGTTGLSPSLAPPSRGLGARSAAEDASPDYNSDSEAVRFSSWADPGSLAVTKGILGLPHSSRRTTTIRGSFQPTTSRASTEGDSSLGQPHHKHGRPISAPMPCVPIRGAWLGATRCVTPRQACPRPDGFGRNLRSKTRWYMFHGSFCFAGFDNDPSAGSPTETLLRLLLPLNDKVQWNSRDVAGGEPPTSPRILTLHRTIQSVGATGRCVQRAGT
ncbi:hypothetical protein L1887_42323 [Cichorium endivia]|nr:hypothetical protein L1887_42323 [Cichorium endivia]